MSQVFVSAWCICDKCEKVLSIPDHTKTRFIYRARLAYGWSFGVKSLCPECNGKDLNRDFYE